jgi:hypothetical protein
MYLWEPANGKVHTVYYKCYIHFKVNIYVTTLCTSGSLPTARYIQYIIYVIYTL